MPRQLAINNNYNKHNKPAFSETVGVVYVFVLMIGTGFLEQMAGGWRGKAENCDLGGQQGQLELLTAYIVEGIHSYFIYDDIKLPSCFLISVTNPNSNETQAWTNIFFYIKFNSLWPLSGSETLGMCEVKDLRSWGAVPSGDGLGDWKLSWPSVQWS